MNNQTGNIIVDQVAQLDFKGNAILIPKALFKDERFKSLSCEAKVLYGLMLDRMSLSMENGWLDSQNRAYILYTIDDVKDDLNCGSQKAVKLMNELDSEKGIGLIEKKRLGQGRANVIYLYNFPPKNEELY